MTMPASYQLASLIRETVRSVEHRTDITPNDPDLLELRRTLLLRIAELEDDSRDSAPAIRPARVA